MPRSTSPIVIVLLTALVAFGAISTDLYLPSLPSLVRVFETDVATVQLTLSVFLLGFAVSQLVYGPLSDRFGRRPVLLLGIVIFTAASIACALAPTIEALIVGRFFQAVGACCGPVLGRAVVRDVYGREQGARILAYMAMAMAVAPAIGPTIGGYLMTLFGWQSNFWLLAGFGLATWLGVLVLLRETNSQLDPAATRLGQQLRNYSTLFRHRLYLGYVLTVASAYSGLFSFLSGSSYVFMDTLGLSEIAYGLAFGSIVLGYMLGTFLTGRLTLRFGIPRLIGVGGAVCLVSGLALTGVVLGGLLSVPAVIVPVFCYMAGTGLVLPNAWAGAAGPFPTMAGLASALLGFIQMAVAAAVGIAVGLLTDGSGLSMAVAIALGGLGAVVAHRLLVVPGEAARLRQEVAAKAAAGN